MNSVFLQVFYAIFSGLSEAMAISNEILPFGSPFLALFCMIPLYKALYNAKSFRQAFLIFFAQTITVHVISSFWLANFHGFAIFTLGASALGTGALGGFTGMVVYIFPRALQRMNALEIDGGKKSYVTGAKILWFSSTIVFWEWIKSTGFLAYPWGTLSMAAYRWKIFTQIADITGVWGISFLFATVSALIGEGLNLLDRLPHSQDPSSYGRSYIQCVKFAAVLFICAGVYGIFSLVQVRTPIKKLNAVIVQQNIDPWEGGDKASIAVSKELTEQQINMMREAGQEPDLVLWSEGVLSRPFPNSIEFYRTEYPVDETLSEFISRMNVPFIIGGTTLVDRYKRLYSNSAFLFDCNGEYAGFYSKMHLVPFAEQIPFAQNPLMKWFMGEVVGMKATLNPGTQVVLFKIPLRSSRESSAPLWENMSPYATIELDAEGRSDEEKSRRYIENPERSRNSMVSFTTPICFEDAFSDVCSKLYKYGSEVFLNITNDSWSKMASSEYQHFIAASYRAIEYRTTLVRCTNSGYSAVVDPEGRILCDMEVFKQQSVSCQIPIYERKWTVYSVLGDWFAYMIFFFMGLFFVKECAQATVPEKVRRMRRFFTKLREFRTWVAAEMKSDDETDLEDHPTLEDQTDLDETKLTPEDESEQDKTRDEEIHLEEPKFTQDEISAVKDEDPSVTKPRRGRKPKASTSANTMEEKKAGTRKSTAVGKSKAKVSEKKSSAGGTKQTETKAKRGRPPLAKPTEVKQKRGRPPAVKSAETKPKRGRPPAVKSAEIKQANTKNKRGRPPLAKSSGAKPKEKK